MASGPPFSPPPPPYDPQAPYGTRPADGESPYQWLPPASLPSGGWQQETQSGQGSGRAAMYELRPLSTGEVLDRTFSLYRSRFLLFAGIATVASVARLVGSAVQLGVQQTALRHAGNRHQVLSALVTFGASALFLMVFAITQAATVWAMGEVYLGRSASVGEALRVAAKRWGRYLGIALWQIGSGLWPALAVGAVAGGVFYLNRKSFGSLGEVGAAALIVVLVLLAFAVGTILYLRNLLAVPAAVREDLGVRAAMRRSKELSQGAKGKLFLVLLIAGALYMVMAMVLGVFVAIIAFGGTMARGGTSPAGLFLVIGIVSLVVAFVGYTLISPVILIGVSMVYFDQRVRKEAYDVAVLLGEEIGPAAAVLPPVAFADPPVVEPESGASGL